MNDDFQTQPHKTASADEFSPGASEWPELMDGQSVSRRRFLQLMGASMALAGIGIGTTGCSDRPSEQIVPRVDSSNDGVPGNPVYFATSMSLGGYARGLLVQSREGRPVKIEGNPSHPASLGGTDVFAQASVLDLYDPDRSRFPARAGTPLSWSNFMDELRPRLRAYRQSGGVGLRILSRPVVSPTLARQMREFKQAFPNARWHQYDPLARMNTQRAALRLFGSPVNTIYHFDQARVIVSLDADFLFDDPASLRNARQFANGRRVRRDQMAMNRLYVVESTLSLTGSMADHRLPLRPGQIQVIADELAARIGLNNKAITAGSEWIDAVVADLQDHRGASIVIAGESQPPAVHILAHQINAKLGNVGKTVTYSDAVEADPVDVIKSLNELVADMRSGAVSALFILGGNPAYDAPADSGFREALEALTTHQDRPEFTVHLSLHNDETSFRCLWHLAQSHYLESWGDGRAFDGTASIVQPLIRPLHSTRSQIELMELILGRSDQTAHEAVRQTWKSHSGETDFEKWWSTALQTGTIAGSALPAREVKTNSEVGAGETHPAAQGDVDVVFRPDPTLLDGSFANNPWLQELPKPFTKLVWENAALISPSTAQRYELVDGDCIQLGGNGLTLETPVMIVPGLPDYTVTLHLGYGRTRAGNVGSVPDDPALAPGFGSGRHVVNGASDLPPVAGVNAYALRTAGSPWFTAGASLAKTGRRHRLVTTRSHHAMASVEDESILDAHSVVTSQTPTEEKELHNRKIIRAVTIAELSANPDAVRELAGEAGKRPLLSLYPGWDYSKGHQWAMSIDLTTCIGCNACIVACQAENNIPVVGRTEVARQREMHWIRIDDYFGGSINDPRIYHQPVPCMHCENAPCEVVCPTGATTHSAEGLNQMTYNRCVGTRYCSNNCPYKVRRFNFFDYGPNATRETEQLQRNPEVTVRTRGVMEKCTYCVQRLQRTRIQIESMRVELAEKARTSTTPEERARLQKQADELELASLESLETACAQACPTSAIVFGDMNYRGTQISRVKSEPHDYGLLTELTTRPRTTYLAHLSNPNPQLKGRDNS